MPPYEMPMMANFTSVPMFGQAGAPTYTGPFNMDIGSLFGGGQMGMAAQFLGPYLMQSMLGPQKQGFQFLPTQNLYDQMVANQYFQGQQQVAAAGAQRDLGTLRDIIGGGMATIQGHGLSGQQRAQAHQIASQVSNVLPYAEMFLGPDVVDQLMGSRGSATIMARTMGRAMYRGLDPVTGAVGASTESQQRIATEVFEQLYGEGANLAEMRGVSAGAAGSLYEELSMRGMVGGLGTAGTMGERYTQAAGILGQELDRGTLRRLAEQTESIQAIRERGDRPTGADWTAAEEEVTRTHTRMREMAGREGGIRTEDIEGLGEIGGDLVRTADATRIAGRLKNLSGVVNAMRDIFGDMGRPNAPMREIMNGLEALTQGNLANMPPGQVEQMVRTSYNLAQQSGMGFQGMLGLQAQGAALADQLGVSRALLPQITQGAMAYGAAARTSGGYNIPGWGGLSLEESTLMEEQLRVQGAASQTANQMNAVMRLRDQGLIRQDTEAAAMAEAIAAGRTTYEWGGEQRDVNWRRNAQTGDLEQMSPQALMDILEAGGVDRSVAQSILSDRRGSQEYAMRYDTQEMVRRAQRDIDITPRMSQAMANTLAMTQPFGEGGAIRGELEAAGITGETQSDLQRLIGQDVADAFFRQGADAVRDTDTRQKTLSGLIRRSMKDRFARQLRIADPNLSEADATARAEEMVGKLDDRTVRGMAAGMEADFNALIQADPNLRGARDIVGVWQKFNDQTLDLGARHRQTAEAKSRMQTALSGLGRAGPIRRIAEQLRTARGGVDFAELLRTGLGGIDLGELGEANPLVEEIQAQMEAFRGAERDETGAYTEKGMRQVERSTQVVKAMVEGGRTAAALREQLIEEGMNENDPLAQRLLVAAGEEGGLRAQIDRLGLATEADVGRKEVQRVQDRAAEMTTAREAMMRKGGDTEENRRAAREAADAFAGTQRDMIDRITADTATMEQLGAGSTAVMTQLADTERELRAFAGEHDLTVGELLSGRRKDGTEIPKEVVAQGRKLQASLEEQWDKVGERLESGRMPALSAARRAGTSDWGEAAADAQQRVAAGEAELAKVAKEAGVDVADVMKGVQEGTITGGLAARAKEAQGEVEKGYETLTKGDWGKQKLEAIQKDSILMHSLGAKQKERIAGLQDQQRQLQELAVEEGVTVGELLSGRARDGRKISEERMGKARALHEGISAGWGELSADLGKIRMPGDDRQAMPEWERQLAKDMAEFRSGKTPTGEQVQLDLSATTEEQAAALKQHQVEYVTQQLAERSTKYGAMSEADQTKFRAEAKRMLGQGDRAEQVFRALQAERALDTTLQEEITDEKGMIEVMRGGKKQRVKLEKATEAERISALESYGKTLEGPARESFERMLTDTRKLRGLGAADADQMRTQLERYRVAKDTMQGGGAAEEPKEMKCTGQLTIIDQRKGQLDMLAVAPHADNVDVHTEPVGVGTKV